MKKNIIIKQGVAQNNLLKYIIKEIENGFLEPGHFLEKTVGKKTLNKFLGRLNEIKIDISRNLGAQGYAVEVKNGHSGTVIKITGGDHCGILYAVRDLMHHYLKDIAESKSLRKVFRSSPAILNRWLWSWDVGIHNFERYLDMASEWKFNGLIMWNSKVPKDIRHIVNYAHARGIKIILGFSWGYPDFTNKYFVNRYPKNAKTYVNICDGKKNLLCPTDTANRKWIKDFVVNLYRKEYRGLDIDGIYFQTWTESNRCPCTDCSEYNTAELVINWSMPIRESIKKISPGLFISWGICTWYDNIMFKEGMNKDVSGGIKPSEYPSFKAVPLEDQISWEGAEYPEKNHENTIKLLSARGNNDNVALLYRIFGYYGLVLNRNNNPKIHRRIILRWKEIEKGWVPKDGKWHNLKKINNYIEWIKTVHGSKARKKTIVHLLEGNDWGYYNRIVPLITSEIEWNPYRNRKEFARLFNDLKTISDLSGTSPLYKKYKAIVKI